MMNSPFIASAAFAGHWDVSKEIKSHWIIVRDMSTDGQMASYMDDFKWLQVLEVLRPVFLRSCLCGFTGFSFLVVFRNLNLHFLGRSTDLLLDNGQSRIKTCKSPWEWTSFFRKAMVVLADKSSTNLQSQGSLFLQSLAVQLCYPKLTRPGYLWNAVIHKKWNPSGSWVWKLTLCDESSAKCSEKYCKKLSTESTFHDFSLCFLVIRYPALIPSGVTFSPSLGLPLCWEPEIVCSAIGFHLPFMPLANLIKSCCIKWEKHAVKSVVFKMH